MPSPTFSSILGVTLGSLFYGSRLYAGFLNSDSEKRRGSFSSPEGKINNHLKVALEKIEKWKRDNDINCQIILAYGSENSQTVNLNFADIIAREQDDIFRRIGGEKLNKFERLAHDLVLEKIGLIDTAGDDTDYDYSKKLKEACQGKSSITLTFQEVSWDAKGREQQNHSFWLPKDDQNIRTKVFNYLKRDLETPFRKIKKWKDDNNINCEINLVVDSTETITISAIEKKPSELVGSPLFARDLEGDVKGTRLSKFEKLANDLTTAKIELKDEAGDDVFFEYSKKIQKECNGSEPITLSFKNFIWSSGLDKQKAKQQHNFWVPGDSDDSREQIFNYLDRDISAPIAEINEWKKKHNITCPIKMRMHDSKDVSIDDILREPNKYIGDKHFSKNEQLSDGTRISGFQKLVNGLNGKVEITDKYGYKEIYDYIGKLKQVCEDKGEIILVHYSKKWKYRSNPQLGEQQLTYWFPDGERDENTMILKFLDWDRKTLIEKIEKWEKDNSCEITLVLMDRDDKNGKGTAKKIIETPNKFTYGVLIFDRKWFIGENDEIFSSEVPGSKRISQIEKLVKDLTKEPKETKGKKPEVKSSSFSEEIKRNCKGGKIELAWKQNGWQK